MTKKTKLIQIAILLASILAGSGTIINTSTTLATELNANHQTENLFSKEEREEIEKIKTAYIDNLSTKSLEQRRQTNLNKDIKYTPPNEGMKLIVEQLTEAHKKHPQVVDIFFMMHNLQIWTPGVWHATNHNTDQYNQTSLILENLQRTITQHDNALNIFDFETKREPTGPDLKIVLELNLPALYEGTKLLKQLQDRDTESEPPKTQSQTEDIKEHIMTPHYYYSSPPLALGYTKYLAEELPKLTNLQTPQEPIDLQQLDDLQLINRNLEIIKQITQHEIDDGTYKKLTTNEPNKAEIYKIIIEIIQARITNLDKMIISLHNYIKTARPKATEITIENIKKTNEKLSIILKALLP